MIVVESRFCAGVEEPTVGQLIQWSDQSLKNVNLIEFSPKLIRIIDYLSQWIDLLVITWCLEPSIFTGIIWSLLYCTNALKWEIKYIYFGYYGLASQTDKHNYIF